MRSKGLMPVFTNGTVHDDVKIELYAPPGDECVSIFFGEDQLSLEFSDPAVLDRLAALAVEGAARLRAKVAADDEPAGAVG